MSRGRLLGMVISGMVPGLMFLVLWNQSGAFGRIGEAWGWMAAMAVSFGAFMMILWTSMLGVRWIGAGGR